MKMVTKRAMIILTFIMWIRLILGLQKKLVEMKRHGHFVERRIICHQKL